MIESEWDFERTRQRHGLDQHLCVGSPQTQQLHLLCPRHCIGKRYFNRRVLLEGLRQ